MDEISIFTYSLKTEVFLYEELDILSKKFKKINLFCSVNNGKPTDFLLPPNIELHELKYEGIVKKISFILFLKALLSEVFHKKYILRYILKPRYYFAYFNNAYSKAQYLFDYLQTKKINPNSLFYTYWFNDWTFELSLLKAEHKIQKLVTRIHGGDVYEYQHQEPDFFFPFRNFQIKQLKKIIGISQDGLDYISQAYPLSTNKLILSRLGTKDFGMGPLPNNEKPFIMVSCSSFYHYKNVSLIPEILSLIKFNVHWIHIGNEGPELEKVMEAVKKLPANITTEFKGQLSPKEVFEFYQKQPIHLFINTSISEGLPVSLMEAISFGIPIIAPNVGGIKEIANAVTGILYELNTSSKKLSERISSIQNNTKLFDRKAIRNFWENNYSAKKNHTDFYEQLNQI